MEVSSYKERFNVPAVWSITRQVRQRVRQLLITTHPELVGATEIAVSELMENAIKYGTGSVDFECYVASDRVTVVVANEPASEESLQDFLNHIKILEAEEDPFEEYYARLNRLCEISLEEVASPQLGVFRVVAECGFLLGYQYENGILRMTAERPVTRREHRESDGKI